LILLAKSGTTGTMLGDAMVSVYRLEVYQLA
jgi:hypothetical protein